VDQARQFLRLLIYQSKRKDWALAVLSDEGSTVVFGYRKTIEDCKALADTLFVQPFAWTEQHGWLTHEMDHPGITFKEPTTTHYARLWLS